MTTGLERIAAKSRKETDCRFTSLVHHITPSLLQDSLRCIARSSASGVDRESVEEAREQFAVWSKEIIQQIHQKGYRPPPVRRVYIPKPGKQEKRPIGVPTVRDRCIQRATATVLQQVYEPDFLEHSFGGRPGRSAHAALSTLTRTISTHKISWVFEADLKNFFGSLDHGWLMRFVEHRVGDPRILTMIRRWLKAGVMEAGRVDPTERGTPQGGSISVLLSNIYLHYVLDIWFGKVVKPRLEGQAYMCRYLDDFVVCFQLKRDAERFQKALKGRLGKFNLELEPDKTRLVEFGRFSVRDFRERRQRPPTFSFLGFRHHHIFYQAGNYGVGLKTDKLRLNRSMQKLKVTIMAGRHDQLKDQAARINASLRGHYNYFGVPNNSRSLHKMKRFAVYQWRTALSSRSQTGKINWAKYNKILQQYPILAPRLRWQHLDMKAMARL